MTYLQDKTCGCCLKKKPVKDFFVSPRNNDNPRLPYCKQCCINKFNKCLEETNDERIALWCTLAELGIPFLKDIWAKALTIYEKNKSKRQNNIELISAYVYVLNKEKIKVNGFWESEVMMTDFQEKDRTEVVNKDIKTDYRNDIKIWGRYEKDGTLDYEVYDFLNETFNDYTKELDEIDANLEKRYRDLARCELKLRQANEESNMNEIKNAQDILNKQLKLLGLDDFSKHEESEELKTFEKRIAIIEHTKPAECEDLKKYLDIVGYEKEMAVPMRAIRNAIQNTKDYPGIPLEERK